jgi:hypothetical protein
VAGVKLSFIEGVSNLKRGYFGACFDKLSMVLPRVVALRRSAYHQGILSSSKDVRMGATFGCHKTMMAGGKA